MGNIEELTKVFEQEEKDLNRLIKGNRNEAVQRHNRKSLMKPNPNGTGKELKES